MDEVFLLVTIRNVNDAHIGANQLNFRGLDNLNGRRKRGFCRNSECLALILFSYKGVNMNAVPKANLIY